MLGSTGVCDVCGGTDLVHRADDRPEAVATRLAAYRNQTAPLLPDFRERGILRTVDGMAESTRLHARSKWCCGDGGCLSRLSVDVYCDWIAFIDTSEYIQGSGRR